MTLLNAPDQGSETVIRVTSFARGGADQRGGGVKTEGRAGRKRKERNRTQVWEHQKKSIVSRNPEDKHNRGKRVRRKKTAK
jgi:hypothetical protein